MDLKDCRICRKKTKWVNRERRETVGKIQEMAKVNGCREKYVGYMVGVAKGCTGQEGISMKSPM